MPDLSRNATFFIDLARRGRHPAASSGEHAAHEVAESLLKTASAFDHEAMEGMLEFACLCHTHPSTAEDLIHAHQRVAP